MRGPPFPIINQSILTNGGKFTLLARLGQAALWGAAARLLTMAIRKVR